jgi:hypothetical protein
MAHRRRCPGHRAAAPNPASAGSGGAVRESCGRGRTCLSVSRRGALRHEIRPNRPRLWLIKTSDNVAISVVLPVRAAADLAAHSGARPLAAASSLPRHLARFPTAPCCWALLAGCGAARSSGSADDTGDVRGWVESLRRACSLRCAAKPVAASD